MLSDVQKKSAIQITDDRLNDRIVAESSGSALDSVVAAWAVCETLSDVSDLEASNPEYGLEGRIYTGGPKTTRST